MAEFLWVDSVHISDEDILEYIYEQWFPEDVFTKKALAEWAEGNGYISKEKCNETEG
jgi:hypothetical protein